MLVSSIFLAAICAIFVITLVDSYLVNKKLAIQTVTSVGALVDQDISRNIELFNLSLQAVIDGLEDPRIMSLDPELRHLALFDRSTTAEGMGAILVLDKQGNILFDSLHLKPLAINLADRDYFQVHRDQTDAGVYISQPFKSRFRNGDWSIAVSRRLIDESGEFTGVVMGAISLSYFQTIFRKPELGSNGSITLFSDGGSFLARQPPLDNLVGARAPGSVFNSEQKQGAIFDMTGVDGVERLSTIRRLKNLPLLIQVGVSTEEVFGGWYRRAAVTAMALGAVGSLVLYLSMSVGREFQRRIAVEEELADLVVTDPLTGIANRRRFNEHLQVEWARAQRTGKPFCMLMIDVDFFKSYNDAYGHPEGDRALRTIANCLLELVQRPGDLVARYGGEEFAVLLPETATAGARDLGETMRRAVEKLDFGGGSAAKVRLTISVGLGMLNPNRAADASDLIREADRAVYAAKAAGRNCLREWVAGPGRALARATVLQHPSSRAGSG